MRFNNKDRLSAVQAFISNNDIADFTYIELQVILSYLSGPNWETLSGPGEQLLEHIENTMKHLKETHERIDNEQKN